MAGIKLARNDLDYAEGLLDGLDSAIQMAEEQLAALRRQRAVVAVRVPSPTLSEEEKR